MVILSSPSGAGKTTLVKLLSKNKNFHISISHTTRKPRLNEIADKDYYFVDHDKFENLIKNEEFLEYAKVFNHLYGTTRTPVIEKLEKGDTSVTANFVVTEALSGTTVQSSFTSTIPSSGDAPFLTSSKTAAKDSGQVLSLIFTH